MGYITQQAAEQIFLRMMKTGRFDIESGVTPNDSGSTTAGEKSTTTAAETAEAEDQDQQTEENPTDEELQVLAQEFAKQVPEDTFTPAQMQGYLLQHLHSPTEAVIATADWVADEKHRMQEDKKSKKQKRSDPKKRRAEAEKQRRGPPTGFMLPRGGIKFNSHSKSESGQSMASSTAPSMAPSTAQSTSTNDSPETPPEGPSTVVQVNCLDDLLKATSKMTIMEAVAKNKLEDASGEGVEEVVEDFATAVSEKAAMEAMAEIKPRNGPP
jgi:hypothetical protein